MAMGIIKINVIVSLNCHSNCDTLVRTSIVPSYFMAIAKSLLFEAEINNGISKGINAYPVNKSPELISEPRDFALK